MGKNQRTLKHQHQNRSKFKGENPEPKPLPTIEEEPLDVGETETIESSDVGKMEDVFPDLTEKESEGTGEKMTPVDSFPQDEPLPGEPIEEGVEEDSEEEDEASEDDEESDTRKPVVKKVVKKQPECKKCKRAKRDVAKVREYASNRRGVRVKDESDKIIDAVKRMKS